MTDGIQQGVRAKTDRPKSSIPADRKAAPAKLPSTGINSFFDVLIKPEDQTTDQFIQRNFEHHSPDSTVGGAVLKNTAITGGTSLLVSQRARQLLRHPLQTMKGPRAWLKKQFVGEALEEGAEAATKQGIRKLGTGTVGKSLGGIAAVGIIGYDVYDILSNQNNGEFNREIDVSQPKHRGKVMPDRLYSTLAIDTPETDSAQSILFENDDGEISLSLGEEVITENADIERLKDRAELKATKSSSKAKDGALAALEDQAEIALYNENLPALEATVNFMSNALESANEAQNTTAIADLEGSLENLRNMVGEKAYDIFTSDENSEEENTTVTNKLDAMLKKMDEALDVASETTATDSSEEVESSGSANLGEPIYEDEAGDSDSTRTSSTKTPPIKETTKPVVKPDAIDLSQFEAQLAQIISTKVPSEAKQIRPIVKKFKAVLADALKEDPSSLANLAKGQGYADALVDSLLENTEIKKIKFHSSDVEASNAVKSTMIREILDAVFKK